MLITKFSYTLPNKQVLSSTSIDLIAISQFWTGTSMQNRLVQGYIIKKRLMSFDKTPALASVASYNSIYVPMFYLFSILYYFQIIL